MPSGILFWSFSLAIECIHTVSTYVCLESIFLKSSQFIRLHWESLNHEFIVRCEQEMGKKDEKNGQLKVSQPQYILE